MLMITIITSVDVAIIINIIITIPYNRP